MADYLARQDLQRIVIAPETAVGTYTATDGRIIPATGRAKLYEERADHPNTDGYAGAVMSDLIRRAWDAEYEVEITDPKTAAFPTFALLLLASGFESDYTSPTLVLTPSVKPIADFGTFTGADKSPCVLSITEIQRDNAAADRRARMRSSTISGTLKVMRSAPMTYACSIKGLVVGDATYEVGTDYGSVGAVYSTEGLRGYPFMGSITASIIDDSGSDSVTLADFDGLEIAFNPKHERLNGGAYGFDIAPPIYDAPMTGKLKVAVSRAFDAVIWSRFQTATARASITMEQTFGSGATITVAIPCAQLMAPTITNENGKQMLEMDFEVRRATFGTSTAPITITIVHDT